jgi:hypothetical protein
MIIVIAVAVLLRVTNRPFVDLSVQPRAVPKGKTVTVSWTVDAADFVIIKNGNLLSETIGLTGKRTFRVNEPTSFEIRASNGWPHFLTTRSATVSVDVISLPVITKWSADPAGPSVGSLVNLNWETIGADKVTITGVDSSPLSVELNGSHQITVDHSKTFEIVGVNVAGTSRRLLAVNVRPNEAQGAQSSPQSLALESGSSSERPIEPEPARSPESYSANTSGRRLVFLGTQNLESRFEEVIRPEVENYFRSKGYEVVPFTSSSALTLNEYLQTLGSQSRAIDFAVTGMGSLSEPTQAFNLNSRWTNLSTDKVKASVVISVVRLSNQTQIGTSRGSGGASSAKAESPRYGNISKNSGGQTKAVERAIKDALAKLQLSL